MKEIDNFKSLSPVRRNTMLGLFAASLGLVAAAERDVHRRTSADVRGPKILWQIVCLNALGAVSYFRWGRRKPSAASK
ncbi:MAG: hypothetical protein ACLP8S_14240 [Solirubrobacteraceae bacterium]